MGSKTCSKCNITKDHNEFHRDRCSPDGHYTVCKDCKCKAVRDKRQDPEVRAAHAERCRKYKAENPDIIMAYNVKYRAANPDYYRNYKQNNRGYYAEWAKKYYHLNKQKIAERRKIKRQTDITYRLNCVIACAVRDSLIRGVKNGRTWRELLAFTVDELREHLERQFKPGMKWANYGEWNIDHIVPISWFSFVSPEDEGFKQCWALMNLQPMWARDNYIKGNRWTDFPLLATNAQGHTSEFMHDVVTRNE